MVETFGNNVFVRNGILGIANKARCLAFSTTPPLHLLRSSRLDFSAFAAPQTRPLRGLKQWGLAAPPRNQALSEQRFDSSGGVVLDGLRS